MSRTIAIAVVAGLLLSVPAMAETIDEIQVYSDTGVPASPYDGLPVTIQGVITCVKGTYNSGTWYVQDATGGMQIFDGAPVFNLGDEVSIAGTVSNFGGEIQIGAGGIWSYVDSPGVPAPLVLTVNQAIDNDGSGTQTAADYEIVGTLIQVTGTVGFLPGQEPPPWPINTGQGTFGLVDAGDTMVVFVDRTTGIDPSGIQEFDTYQVTGPMSNFSGLLELKPRFQADLVENPTDPAPLISDVLPTPWSPESGEAVTVSATITDNGSITGATLYYRNAGAMSFTPTAMSNTVGDTWEGTIPGTAAAGRDYYVEATDNSAQTSTIPGDAPSSWLNVAVGTTSIIEIQATMKAGSDTSAFYGEIVNVEGIITVAPGELGSASNYIMGDPKGGSWSGLYIYEGSGVNDLYRGDLVRISGTISEFSGSTEILPQAGSAVELVDINQPLPPVVAWSSDELDTSEALESVIVQTYVSTVVDTTVAGAEWLVMDAGSDSMLYVDPAPAVTHVATIGEFQKVTGLLDTRFGRNEVVPRDDSEVELFAFTGTDGDQPAGRTPQVTSVKPNPFNPSTDIEFSIPRQGLTDLAIFSPRGERVRTLVSGRLEGGTHTRQWDGRDQAGAVVSSGIYYLRLRFETMRPSVTKLTLLK